MTHQQAFFLVSGIIFGLVAVFHALHCSTIRFTHNSFCFCNEGNG